VHIEVGGLRRPAITGTARFGVLAERTLFDELLQDAASYEGMAIEAGFRDFGKRKFGLIEKMCEN
jgi:hypothetical protein